MKIRMLTMLSPLLLLGGCGGDSCSTAEIRFALEEG